MLDRFNLGKLISFEKTLNGVMGQPTSSLEDFVLKGDPIYPGQFVEEKYFVENLHKRTNIPVPFPYLVDESDDFFGWSYSIMPRLYGKHMNSGKIKYR